MAPDRAYRASERGSSQFYDARRVQLPAWKPAGRLGGSDDFPPTTESFARLQESPKQQKQLNYHGNPQPAFLGVMTHIFRA